MKKKSDRAFKELMQIENQKKGVWDERKRDLGYKAHLRELERVEKKVDNESPLIASSKFFRRAKYIAQQRNVELRIKSNISILKRLNEIQRARGKTDNFNPETSYRETLKKAKEREKEIKLIERYNKEYSKIITSATPKVELTKNLLKRFYDVDRRAIFLTAKQKIVFDFLKHPKMKRLESPTGTRLFIDIRKKDGGYFGRLEVLLFNEQVQQEVINFFLDLCKTSYKDCFIHRIMKDLFIETGDVESSSSVFPQKPQISQHHNRDGLVTMSIDSDGKLSSKFAIIMQPIKVFDDNHLIIGKVIEGRNLITDLNAFGTKFGIPERMFFITVTSIEK